MTENLLRQAEIIQSSFSGFGIEYKVLSIIISDFIITFVGMVPETVKIESVIRLSPEIAMALALPSVTIKREAKTIIIEIPNPEKINVKSFAEILDDYYSKEALAILGMSTEGSLLQLRIDSPSVVHFMIVGATGSGKSFLGRQIVVSLCYNMSPNDLELVLIDVKGSTFLPLNAFPHNNSFGVITSPDQGVDKLNELLIEMESRDATGIKSPLIFVGIEEIADWVSTHGDDVLKPLQRLLQRGREAGIHVMATTQKPMASVLGSLGRANFPVRIVGKTADKKEAKFATGQDNSGAERLEGKGDFILVHGGNMRRFKSFFFNREELNEIIRKVERRN